MKTIVNRDKHGKVIRDLSKIKLPHEMEVDIFKILNPNLTVKEGA